MANNSELTIPILSPSNSNSNNDQEAIGVDDMLRLYAGEFGPWQLRNFIFTSIAWALNALHTIVVVFADREPQWSCTAESPCDDSMCVLDHGTTSTAAEWGLVCDSKYKVGLVQSAFFAGSMLGAGIFGHFSDNFLGRKGTLTLTCIINAISGVLTTFSPSYEAYIALRFITGLGTGGVGLCAFVLATEPVGPTKRGAIGTSTFYFFSIGTILLSILAYISPSWRILYTISSLPSLLFLITIIPFISESPRWYLVHNNYSRAMQIMMSIAKSNGNHIPNHITLTLDHTIVNENPPESAISSSIITVLKSPITRARLLSMTTINLFSSIVYYGLNLNVVNLKANLYLSVILNAIAEAPAYALTSIALRWCERRPLTIGTMWLSGVFCVLGSLFMVDGGARMLCGVMGVFAMAATFDLLFIYTTELFPTVVRNVAFGSLTQAGQIGAIVAPLVVVLGGPWPFIVFGTCGLVGGVLGFYLPETFNQPLYDTMIGIEKGELDKEKEGG